MLKKLNATQVGYLRDTPRPDQAFRHATGPRKAMLNKLSQAGYVEMDVMGYRLTGKGLKAIQDFNALLSQRDIETLKTVRDEKPENFKNVLLHNLDKLVRSDLLRWTRPDLDKLSITEHGRKVLDERGI